MNKFGQFFVTSLVLLFLIIGVIIVNDTHFIEVESDKNNGFVETENNTNMTDKENELISKGIELYFNSEYLESVEIFIELLELNPEIRTPYFFIGWAFSELGMYKDALENYKTAIEFFPDNYRMYAGKGDALISLGEYKEAMLQYQTAIDLGIDEARIYFNNGIAAYELGMFRDAIISFDKAIELEELNINNGGEIRELGIAPYVRKALVLQELGMIRDILDIADKVIEIDKLDSTGYFLKGAALQELGRFSDSEYYLNIAENL